MILQLKTNVTLGIFTPIVVSPEVKGSHAVSVVSTTPTDWYVLPTVPLEKGKSYCISPLSEASGISGLPFRAYELLLDGLRQGYVIYSTWPKSNTNFGLMFISHSWWNSTKITEIPEGELLQVFKNRDLIIFNSLNRVAYLCTGEICSDIQDSLRI